MSESRDFSSYGGLLPEERIGGLKRCLKRIPDYSWMLVQPHPTEDRLQGDILIECPTVYLGPKGEVRSRVFPVMVLNNTCDLPDDRLDNVTVVPLVDFEQYLQFEGKRRNAESLVGYADAIRRNDKTELFYLPNMPGFSKGALAMLDKACSISAELYRAHNGRRLASFSQTGFYFFLIKLTNHIARAETKEITREEPTAA